MKSRVRTEGRSLAQEAGILGCAWAINVLMGTLAIANVDEALGVEPRDSHPKVVVDPYIRDLGAIPETKQFAQAAYRLKNTGRTDLHIKRIRLSCACLEVSEVPQVLSPGAEGNLVLRVRNIPQPERHTYYALITTNDPNNKFLKLTVKWQTRLLWKVTPERLTFNNLREGEIRSFEIAITATRNEKEFRVIKATGDAWISIDSIKRMATKGNSPLVWKIMGNVRAYSPLLRNSNARIVITTTCAAMPSREVPAELLYHRTIRPVPRSITFQCGKGGVFPEPRILTIKSAERHGFLVENIDYPPFIVVEAIDGCDQVTREIRFRVSPIDQTCSRPATGVIQLRLKNEGRRCSIIIPVILWVNHGNQDEQLGASPGNSES